MAKVSRFVTVSVSTRFQQDDERETEFGMSVPVEIPRGAKLRSRILGVAVAKAAVQCLDKMYFVGAVSYQVRKTRELKRAEATAAAGSPDPVDAVVGVQDVRS